MLPAAEAMPQPSFHTLPARPVGCGMIGRSESQVFLVEICAAFLRECERLFLNGSYPIAPFIESVHARTTQTVPYGKALLG
jgi:hypothetical protein